jgi:hypothetical protein
LKKFKKEVTGTSNFLPEIYEEGTLLRDHVSVRHSRYKKKEGNWKKTKKKNWPFSNDKTDTDTENLTTYTLTD